MKRIRLLNLMFVACVSIAAGQIVLGQYVMPRDEGTVKSQSDPDMSPLRTLFETYTNTFFQEKVFVHMNKNSYQGDEIMWFKAYRVDAITHSPQLFSGLVYADIFDPTNKQIARIMLSKRDSCFVGSYKLPPAVISGYYTLTAYTYWMQNYPKEFYFSKSFYVQNPKDMDIRSSVQFKPDFVARKVAVTANFTKKDGVPYRNSIFLVLPFSNGRGMEISSHAANKEGNFGFEFSMDSMVTDLSISFDHGNKVSYSRNFKVPVFNERLDVQFMPEGGNLLGGVEQRVAFKVVGADGRSVEAGGEITDKGGNLVTKFTTTHKGMGVLSFKPIEDEKYTAKLTTPDGRSATVRLPSVVDVGVGITASTQAGMLKCRVVSTEYFQFSGLSFVAQCRGKVLTWEELTDSPEINIPLDRLPEGIIQLFIINHKGFIFSERLVFVNRDESAKMAVNGLKAKYYRREHVEAEIDISEFGTGQFADLSVSVEDAKRTLQMSSDNIASYLLMSSDIKGSVEEPLHYFDTRINAEIRCADADLLMMTQGWTRFDLGDIFSKKAPNLNYEVELSQSMSGRIFDRLNPEKKLDMPVVALLAPKINGAWIIEPDAGGYFNVPNVNFPNKTIFIIQGTHGDNHKGRINLTIDEQKFKPYTPERTDRGVFISSAKTDTVKTKEDPVLDFYDTKAPRFYYDAEGQKVYILTANIASKKNISEERKIWGDDLLTRVALDDILDAGIYHSLRDWLLAQDGVEIKEDHVLDALYDPLALYSPNDPSGNMSIFIKGERARFVVSGDYLSDSQLYHGSSPYPQTNIPNGSIMTVMGQTIPSVFANILAINGYANNSPNLTSAKYNLQQLLDMPMSAISTLNIINVETESSRLHYGYAVKILTKNLSGEFKLSKPSMFEFYPLGYNKPDEFYKPVYGTKADNPEPDERVTLHWDPNVKIGPDGKAKISFYMNDIPSEYLMTIQGVTSQGKPIIKQVVINQ